MPPMPREDQAFTNNPPTNTNELLAVLRYTEQRNHDLRLRNGELYLALEKSDPEACKHLTPLDSYPTRHTIINNVIEMANQVAQAWNVGSTVGHPDPEAMDDLANTLHHHNNYWNEVHNERKKRADTNAKRQTSRDKTKKQKQGQA